MQKIGLKILLGWVLFLPITAYSLGLGEIDVRSFLNQPLKAEILVISARQGEVDDLIVDLATRSAFTRASLSRPSHLNDLKFKVNKSEDGTRATISVTTVTAVKEPVLNFLVEADWAKGKMFREFTVLLDPPYFAQQASQSQPKSRAINIAQAAPLAAKATINRLTDQQSQANPPKQIPIVNQTSEAEELENTRIANANYVNESSIKDEYSYEVSTLASTPVVTESVSQRQQGSQSSTPAFEDETPETIAVAKGQTLWSLASTLKTDDVSMSQIMLALQRANAESFGQDNINNLKKGAVLRVPTKQDMLEVSERDAYVEVLEQNGLWDDYLVSTGNANAVNTSASGNQNLAGKATKQAQKAQSSLSILTADDGESDNASLRSDESNAQISKLRKQLLLSEEKTESIKEERDELAVRVEMLKDELAKSNELLDLMAVENNAMASMQQNVRQGNEPALAEETTPIANSAQQEPLIDEIRKQMLEEAPIPEPVIESTDNQTPIIDTPVIQTPIIISEDDGSSDMVGNIISLLMANLALIGGAIAALLIAIGGFVFMKKRKSKKADESDEITDDLLSEEEPLDALEEDATDDDALEAKDIEPEAETDEPSTEEYAATVTALQTVEDQFSSTAVIDSAEMAAIAEESNALEAEAEVKEEIEEEVVEQDETLDEVDVYLAYSLFENAEELLKEKLSQTPDRADYRAKLLDTYFATQNKDAFIEEAGLLFGLGEEAKKYWKRVQTMGYELDPSNSMFADGEDGDLTEVAIAKPDAADFDIGFDNSDESEFDMSFTEEDTSLDLAVTADSNKDGEADLPDDLDALEFNLDDFENDDTAENEFDISDDTQEFSVNAETQEFNVDDIDFKPEDLKESIIELEEEEPLTAAKEESLEFDLDDFEDESEASIEINLDDIEPDLDLSLDSADVSIDDVDELSSIEIGVAVEDEDVDYGDTQKFTAYDEDSNALIGNHMDMEIEESIQSEEDMSIDLGAADNVSEEATPESLDLDMSDFDVDPAEETGEIDISGLDFSSSSALDLDVEGTEEKPVDVDAFLGSEETGIMQAINIEENAELEEKGDNPAIDMAVDLSDEIEPVMDADIDLQDTLVMPAKQINAEQNENLDGEFDLSDFESDGVDINDDLSLSEIDNIEGLMLPDDVDEVATKLDLAKAYQDMGDIEGARDSLEEVMAEGSAEQKKEASALLDQLN